MKLALIAPILLTSLPLTGQRPVAHWSFDGPAPSDRLVESYGSALLNATQVGGLASWSTRAGFGEVLANGSSTAHLSVSNAAPLALGDDNFSLSFWHRRTSGDGSTAGLIDALDGIGNGFQLFYQADNTIRVRLDDDDGRVVIADTVGPQFSLNTWRHCYLGIDRENDLGRIYLDGQEVSTPGGFDISALTGSLTANQNWLIGSLNASTPAAGQIDDLAVFDRLLIPAELSQLSSDSPVLTLFPAPPPPVLPPPVTISPPSSPLPAGSLVTLTIAPAQEIRFTLDGSDPTPTSPLYNEPIVVSGSLEVRARAFSDDGPGPITSARYLTVPTTPPNLLVIMADDLGYNDLGCYGAATVATPHLDRLAAEGLRLTQFTTAGPGDLASQYALFTGRLARRSLLPAELAPTANGLDPREWTLAESLRKEDYDTALIGAWHLGATGASHPTGQGFSLFYGLPFSLAQAPPLQENTTVVEAAPDPATLLDSFTDRAVAHLDSVSPDRPFFLCFAPPSLPATGTSLLGDYGNRIEALDQSVGTLLAALAENDFAENTLVLFLSDSGADRDTGSFPTGSNGQLRDGKGTTWEGGLRTPLIARWPAAIAPGQDSRAVLWLPDLAPSLTAICQAYRPQNRIIDGLDESAILLGAALQPRPDKTVLSYRHSGGAYELATARTGPWKLHKTRVNSDPENTFTAAPPLLYQLEVDPTERIRREGSEAALVSEIDAAIASHEFSLAPPQLPPSLPAIIASSGIIVLPAPAAAGDATFGLSFTRPATSLNDDYLLQHSTDLMTWADLALAPFIASTTIRADDIEEVSLEISPNQFPAPQNRRFIRLKSTRP